MFVHPYSLFSDYDIALLQRGAHFRLYRKFGSHTVVVDGEPGVYFAVWAPNAKKVSVTGDFNRWDTQKHELLPRWDKSGIWEGFIPGLGKGTVYKYHITMHNGAGLDKGDPYALRWEAPPRTASIVWPLEYSWNDQSWLRDRSAQAGSRPGIERLTREPWPRVVAHDEHRPHHRTRDHPGRRCPDRRHH